MRVGDYELLGEVARGGMATVHLGTSDDGRRVAIKRLHAQYAREPDFCAMFLDEARIAARIDHPNVVRTFEVVAHAGELFLVMEYVEGLALAALEKRLGSLPLPIVTAIVIDVLTGLHAAHEATSERGEPLAIVHRDVTPQNVLVGTDGVARLADFGIAKAFGRLHTTRDGAVKGKLPYMAPEQLRGKPLDRRADVYAVGVVLWGALAGRPLFAGEDEAIIERILVGEVPALPGASTPLQAVVARAIGRQPTSRFTTAAAMACALAEAAPRATPDEVSTWLRAVFADAIGQAAVRVEVLGGDRSRRAPTGMPGELKRRATVAPLVVGLILLAVGVGAVVLARTHPKNDPKNAGPGVVVAPTASAVPPPSPRTSTEEAPPEPGLVSAPRPRTGPRRRPALDCTVPYITDETGKRTYRRECLPKK